MRTLFFSTCLGLFSLGVCHADTLTYVETIGGVSGNLGGERFTDATLTVRGVGDPSTYVFTDPLRLRTSSESLVDPTVSISGLGTFALLSPFQVSYSYRGNALDVSSAEGFLGRLFPSVSSVDPYDYTVDQSVELSGTGLIYDVSSSSHLFYFATSGGTLAVSSENSPLTFQATASTPEPSSFALLGTGMLGVAGVLRKRFA